MAFGREVSGSLGFSARPALGGPLLSTHSVVALFAGPARTSAPAPLRVGADVQIVSRHRVSLGAELEGVYRSMLLRGKWRHVRRTPASLIGTLVMQFFAFWNRTDQRQPSGLMHWNHPVPYANAGVALSVAYLAGQRSVRHPALPNNFGTEPQPVNQGRSDQPLMRFGRARSLDPRIVLSAVAFGGARTMAIFNLATVRHIGSVA